MMRDCVITPRILLTRGLIPQILLLPRVEFCPQLFDAGPLCLLISPLQLFLGIEMLRLNESVLLLLAQLGLIFLAVSLGLYFALVGRSLLDGLFFALFGRSLLDDLFFALFGRSLLDGLKLLVGHLLHVLQLLQRINLLRDRI